MPMPGAAARFHAEAEAAARIQHPNIVQVFEVGENDGLGYLVLEYVAGEGLDRKLSGALQDPRESARLIETLARAIHFAHQRGIVHRDLKPANVLHDRRRRAQDHRFRPGQAAGARRRLDAGRRSAGHAELHGPEQVRGRSDQITPATDVYALGAILYEMLTGRPPFKGTTPLSTLEQVSTPGTVEPQQNPAPHAARPRDHLPQVPAEGSAPAIRGGLGPGRRPAAVSRQQAGSGPADAALGARVEMGQTSSRCGRRALLCRHRCGPGRGSGCPLQRAAPRGTATPHRLPSMPPI